MSIFGFAPGTKPSDLRFLVHMSNDEGFEKIVTTLSQPTKNAPQSTAYISLSQNPSYYQMSIGIGVEAEMDNIAIAYKENFGNFALSC